MLLLPQKNKAAGVVAISTNYSPSAVKATLSIYTSNYRERMSPGTLAHHVQRKELLTMRRDTLFDIDYGPAVLHQNDRDIICSVLRHIVILNWSECLTIEHSALTFSITLITNALYWAAAWWLIYAYSSRSLPYSFVKERGVAPATIDFPPRLFLSGGEFWNNVWRAFSSTIIHGCIQSHWHIKKSPRDAACNIEQCDAFYPLCGRPSFPYIIEPNVSCRYRFYARYPQTSVE